MKAVNYKLINKANNEFDREKKYIRESSLPAVKLSIDL